MLLLVTMEAVSSYKVTTVLHIHRIHPFNQRKKPEKTVLLDYWAGCTALS